MIFLASTGYIQVRSFASYAQIPIEDAAVTITDKDGNAIAMRLTNQNGAFDEIVAVSVPDISASQSPNTGTIPYSVVNLYARAENFEEIFIENLQIFPGTITVQNLELIPLSELPGDWNKTERFNTPPQNL